MTAPLAYTPAYVGLFVSLLLALACNAFLDIQYGAFSFEMGFWALLFGWTLRVGWKQHGEADEGGKQKQKIVLLIALVLAVLVFIPMWGFPRAGLYMLATLQASQNCVTTTRRHLHFGLLVSAVMVMFAASHFRADWTMLFYLVPYIVAVVFTLVAEQISRRAQSIRESSLGNAGASGQGLAIAAAAGIILLLAGALYVVTPQVSWPYLASKYGQPSNVGVVDGSSGAGGGGQGGAEGDAGGAGHDVSPLKGLPSPAQMREAAGRPGMPEWQASTMLAMADLSEAIGDTLAPVKQAVEKRWEQLKEWLARNRDLVIASLLTLMLAMLLAGLFFLLREIKAVVWLRTRFDYWYLARWGKHDSGRDGAIQFYRAIERLFLLHDTPRPATANTREFLREATYYRDALQPPMTELTGLFERFRYGGAQPGGAEIGRMRALYRALFESLA